MSHHQVYIGIIRKSPKKLIKRKRFNRERHTSCS